jgi:GAF domain-containing protein
MCLVARKSACGLQYLRCVRFTLVRRLTIAEDVSPAKAEGACRSPLRDPPQLSGMLQLTARLSDSVTTEEVTAVALEFGRTALGAEDGAICVAENDGSIEVVRSFGENPPFDRASTIDAVLSQEGIDPHPVITVPLVAAGRTLGAIAFRLSSARPMTARLRSVLEVFGRQCAIALDRARLRVAAEDARRELEDAMSKTMSCATLWLPSVLRLRSWSCGPHRIRPSSDRARSSNGRSAIWPG